MREFENSEKKMSRFVCDVCWTAFPPPFFFLCLSALPRHERGGEGKVGVSKPAGVLRNDNQRVIKFRRKRGDLLLFFMFFEVEGENGAPFCRICDKLGKEGGGGQFRSSRPSTKPKSNTGKSFLLFFILLKAIVKKKRRTIDNTTEDPRAKTKKQK